MLLLLIIVNNFGEKPANCIATCALHGSADKYCSVYPTERKEVKERTYIDDGLTAAPRMSEALIKTRRWDEILDHCSMRNKGWTFSGDDKSDVDIGRDQSDMEKVLGLAWDPKSDSFVFKTKLHLKVKIQKEEQIHELSTLEELSQYRDQLMTHRELLSNVHRIFDPLGLLARLLIQAKLLLRECWDDILPDIQCEKWMDFLSDFLTLGKLTFPRSLWPDAEVVGLPMLIIFSDGSLVALGASAHIRWELKAGGYWIRLIMGKCKIVPKNILSIPRMKLNGAVLRNRVKNFILKDTSFKFSKVYQLVQFYGIRVYS